ncbi:carbon-nitrogen hydrolase family protein [Fulvivirga sedimenti]|uniref:Carbon-nitrogen hydrolase family protein n=1 Tax=Fulvivirga sedimenti TaxID=2879465 RepID=A0A9X1HLG2_9BACT|nr:carbon-nitrogen hydrolase family protein [Fulvivirga sedimenti]MCA6074076.1 carbon-nitrogen hydrolase family protein [Fulvivirga sedimenti]
MTESLRTGLAQLAPVLLNKHATTEKMLTFCDRAGRESCDLLIFSEALLPGYPFWIEHTDGARFESDLQKEFFLKYYENAVDIPAGDLTSFCEIAKKYHMAIYLGCIEKPVERGMSLYCSLVYINQHGEIDSVHRKLVPTYEERLFWSPGDGNGLQTHKLKEFRVGGLNCWENWMPSARMALYGQGEEIHISVWPGSQRNTEQIVPFIAREGRCYSVGVGGIFRKADITSDIPASEQFRSSAGPVIANGGTCVAGPDGKWLLPPQTDIEDLFIVDLSRDEIIKERLNFDPAGHYSRPDVLELRVNKTRQTPLSDDLFST